MKRFIFLGGHAMFTLSAMVAFSPDIDRGLNASLDEETKQAGASGPSGISVTAEVGTERRMATLQDSLAAQGIGTVAEVSTRGRSGKVLAVHKKDHEGILLVDAFSGAVIPSEDAPEWATDAGLVMAVLGERHIHYSAALGPLYTPDMRQPDALAFEDLDWLSINPEDGTETVIEADTEHRMDVMASILGIDREEGTVAGATAEVEIAYDNSRTGEEMAAFTEAQERGFQQATGTNAG